MRSIRQRWEKLFGRFIRSCRSFWDFLPIAVFMSLVLVLGGTLIADIAFHFPAFDEFFRSISGDDDNMREFLVNYSLFIGIWILFFIFVLPRKKNWPMLKSLAPKKNTLRHIGAGILLGFGSNAFCILMSFLLGDIKLYYYGFEPLPFFAFVIAVFIQSGAEELTDRLYLYSKLRRRYVSPLVAVLVNSVVFALMHKGNDGFTWLAGAQIFLVAIVFSELVYWYDGLWIAMTFHASWNFCQSIFFGLPNSGIVSSYSVFKLDAASAENGFFYNVNFGVEGSVGAALVLLVMAVVLFVINRNKPEKNDIWASYDVPATAGAEEELPVQQEQT